MKRRDHEEDIIAQLRGMREDEARDPAATERGRAAFLMQAEKLRQAVSESPMERLNKWIGAMLPFPNSSVERRPMVRALVATLIAFVLLVGGSAATALASQDSLPGDVLYSVKAGLERVELALTSDLAGDFALYMSFANTRLDEMAALLATDRADDAERAAEAYQELIERAREILDKIRLEDPALAAELEADLQASLDQFAAAIAGMLGDYPELSDDFLHDVLDFTDDDHDGDEEENEGEDAGQDDTESEDESGQVDDSSESEQQHQSDDSGGSSGSDDSVESEVDD